MKYQVGDSVLLIHTGEKATVVDIINKKMLMLEADGIRFPAYMDQVEFPYFKAFSEKKKEAPGKSKVFIEDVKKEKKSLQPQKPDGIRASFIPVMETDEFGDDVVETLKLHLLNRTGLALHFTYKEIYFGETEFEISNTIQAFEDFYLHDIPFSDLSDSPQFSFDFSLVQPDKKKADHYETSLRLKPKQVFTRIEELRKKGEATFSYKLLEEYPDRVEEPTFDMSALASQGYKIYDASKLRQHLEPAKQEVDLHIEKLSPDYESMDNLEMLALQLSTFEKYLDLAIAHRQPRLIAIHGVGTGKLRDEIHEILRLRREVKTFVNRYHPAYGYGATEIYFKY